MDRLHVKVLVHACCGPCSIRPLAKLREEGARAAVLFFNPNIQSPVRRFYFKNPRFFFFNFKI